MMRLAIVVALVASAMCAPTWTSQLQKATQPQLATMTQLATTTWTLQLSKGSYGTTDNGQSTFNSAVWNSANHIVKRLCSSCSSDYQEMYYRRLTDTTSFDVYDSLKENWFSADNTLGTDFCIYSSYDNAVANTNCWSACNYDDPGIGFPRDCGVSGTVGGQWNSWTRGGKEVAYYTEAANTPSPTRSPTRDPTETPTPAPSPTPTEAPTTRPPSPSPSHTPTEHPTPAPSYTPTEVPTPTPTARTENCDCKNCYGHYAENEHIATSAEICADNCERNIPTASDGSAVTCAFSLHNSFTKKCYYYNSTQLANPTYTGQGDNDYTCYDKR